MKTNSWTPRAERWTEAERVARRILNDPVFRRKTFMAWRRPSQATLRQSLTWYAAQSGINEVCSVLTKENVKFPARAAVRVRLLPLSRDDADWVEQVTGLRVSRRGKDWMVEGTFGKTEQRYFPGETTWKNFRPVAYSRAENTLRVHACALPVGCGRRLEVEFHTEKFTLPAPEGTRWDADANGIRLVCGPDDYHPTCSQLVGAWVDGCESLVDELHRLAEIRRKKAAEIAAAAASLEGVWVCGRDSVAAGNCPAGTQAFADRHGFDLSHHYKPDEILTRANGDTGRARLTIRAAAARHHEEISVGFCKLEDHSW